MRTGNKIERDAILKIEHDPAVLVQREREAWEYGAFLGRKVDAARASMRAGVGQSNDEVEAAFVARRAAATKLA